MLAGAGDTDPIENLGAAGMQFVAGQVLQKLCILVDTGFEDGAVEVLVDQEMA
jgi:hypothetical protein